VLHVSTWIWGNSLYGDEHLAKLEAGVARHLKQPYRWMVCRPMPVDAYLTRVPGCFARLRMFDPDWQMSQGIAPGDRLVCLDLDSVVTGTLDPLFDREEPFVILQGANASNPCPYNGSVQMLRSGYFPDIWSRFSLEAARTVRHFVFPDDQGWLWDKMPDAAGWKAGSASGIYAFQKPGWPSRSTALPADARLVVFPGFRDPSQFVELPWVQQHWRV
jgi:hypothetical protein